jgi:hypothetical protein
VIAGITKNFRTAYLILITILIVGRNDLILFFDDDEGLGNQVNDILAMWSLEFYES